jgi:hypothetical protein
MNQRLIASVESNNVAEVTIQGNDIAGKLKDGKQFKTFAPSTRTLSES